jgi:hypothetical protein
MKFKTEVTINRPLEIVVKYFSDPQYLEFYQDGFLRKDLISGESGQEKAVSKMYYQQGKREMELEETILNQNLPDHFKGYYHHKHMDNTMEARFKAIDKNTTHYESEIHYTAFRGFMPKLLSIIGKSMFRKQVRKWMYNFKIFVEAQS